MSEIKPDEMKLSWGSKVAVGYAFIIFIVVFNTPPGNDPFGIFPTWIHPYLLGIGLLSFVAVVWDIYRIPSVRAWFTEVRQERLHRLWLAAFLISGTCWVVLTLTIPQTNFPAWLFFGGGLWWGSMFLGVKLFGNEDPHRMLTVMTASCAAPLAVLLIIPT